MAETNEEKASEKAQMEKDIVANKIAVEDTFEDGKFYEIQDESSSATIRKGEDGHYYLERLIGANSTIYIEPKPAPQPSFDDQDPALSGVLQNMQNSSKPFDLEAFKQFKKDHPELFNALDAYDVRVPTSVDGKQFLEIDQRSIS